MKPETNLNEQDSRSLHAVLVDAEKQRQSKKVEWQMLARNGRKYYAARAFDEMLKIEASIEELTRSANDEALRRGEETP